MSELHVNQIKGYLSREFGGKVDVSDCKPQDAESVFLTRSLAAYSLVTLTGLSVDQAAACVTDGYQDNGIDAVYFDSTEKQLYLVQSKWSHDGSGTIDRGSVQKFIQGVKDLINGQFQRFNAKIQSKKSEIEQALLDASATFELVLAYTGTQHLGAEPQRDLDDFLQAQNDVSEIMRLRVLRQGDLHSAMATGAKGNPINIDITIAEWGQTKDPVFSVYGQVAASDVGSWVDKYGASLFAPNLRLFLGKTDVNEDMVATIQKQASHFWYFNNGVTALCSSIEKKPFGGDTREFGIFECKDVKIVNGAQTAGSMASARTVAASEVAKAKVLLRLIALEKSPPDFGTYITRYTNTQNRIEKKDFVALDKEQERIRLELQVEGVTYVYKSGGEVPKGAEGFDLTEGAVALACAEAQPDLAVQAKREISRLWEDITTTPYKNLFNGSTFGPNVWRLVKILRGVEKTLQNDASKLSGRDRLIAVHGNRMVAWLTENELKGKTCSDAEIQSTTRASLALLTSATSSLFADSYPASLFKNLSKCKELAKLIATSKQQGASPTAGANG